MVQRIQEIVSRKEEMLPRDSKFLLILSILFKLTRLFLALKCLHDVAVHSRNRTWKRRNVTERFKIPINFIFSFYINYVRLPHVSMMVQRIQEIVSRKEEMLPRDSKFQ